MHGEARADTPTDSSPLGWIAALVVGLGLRLYHLTSQTFWVDEIGVWLAARQPTLQGALSVARGTSWPCPCTTFRPG